MEQPPDPAPTAWSRPSLVVLATTGVVLLGAAALHLAGVVLSVAPENSVSSRYARLIGEHVHPEFDQNWKLFAPDPPQADVTIEARVRTVASTGADRTGPWVDLTARDIAGIRGSLLPSRVDQDLLTFAWAYFEVWNSLRGEHPSGRQEELMARNLKRTVLQRLGPERDGERITGVQIRWRADRVMPPRWSPEPATADRPAYRLLPWWPVQDQDHRGL